MSRRCLYTYVYQVDEECSARGQDSQSATSDLNDDSTVTSSSSAENEPEKAIDESKENGVKGTVVTGALKSLCFSTSVHIQFNLRKGDFLLISNKKQFSDKYFFFILIVQLCNNC